MTTRYAARVHDAREAAGMRQTDLAEAAGVHAMTISRIERGTVTPTIETLAAIAGVLDCSILDLVDPTVDDHDGA